MTVLFYLTAILLVAVLGALAFLRANPARLAAGLSVLGPALVGLAGLGLMLAGRVGLAGVLLSMAAAWFVSGRRRRRARPSPGRVSTVRTAALEMELDHDTGALDGAVLAGRHEGRNLGGMDRGELLELRAALSSDTESLQLLETYLDGRFPQWREGFDGDTHGRERTPPSTGPMTKEEAYEILGLEAGAGAADIREAHRRLMQRVHPDLGGSSFLAARINEARDVLLNGHD
ncbi:DnaJ domain-containing protein [Nitratireductor sp. CAU 1489]|uniref:DnaJ domain-containing protein n=1 Tax=Nitratireductor arenosus TaxID=2682096 RepID=A0A844QJ11_9HYPH|nr:DnaJ domain-containing protein [Nitratireductor arenosus]MVA97911.1 DnaJ domain-containing protein [Nitratireductor arenosus]